MTLAARRTVSGLRAGDLSLVTDELSMTGAATLLLDGSSVHDKASLLEAIARDLDPVAAGADPPTNWDALTDAMRSIVGAQDNASVVLLWTGAETILGSSLADLLTAIEVFTLVADSARRRSTGVGPVRFQMVLVGTGPMFPPYVDIG